MTRKQTAYCGLYCPDCIPSNRKLFQLLEELEELLWDTKFDKYADLKSKNNETFSHYPEFMEVLQEMKNLECMALCTEGGCKEDCKIRECVLEKQMAGCWECDDFQKCELLDQLKGIHPIDHNLEMIKKYGADDWVDKMEKHYKWL